MAKHEKIAIYADYDCDGIPGAVVLNDFFTAIHYTTVVTYIPHRHYEGFGLNELAIERLAADGVTLVITVDCGTSDVAAVKKANALGVDVIVTDHHEPGHELPPAVGVINPKREGYPFPDLCGAAVAFKLAQALLASMDHHLTPGHEKWWLDMVGLATIADMVPLINENRIFAYYGLKVLRKSRRPGLQHLLRKAKINPQYLTEDDIGFTIGPRINAASRMDAPERAFALLTTSSEADAGAATLALESLNNERKGVVATMTRELHAVLKQVDTLPAVIVYGNPLWRPALAGLTANKIAEELARPVFVWGRDGNGVIKGSCRAGGGASVIRLMEVVADSFLEYGGHHASGGFAVAETAIFHLAQRLNEAFVQLQAITETKTVPQVEMELSLDNLHYVFAQQQRLAPFGMGNPKPLYAFKNAVPQTVGTFGKSRKHTKLTFKANNALVEAVAFFTTPQAFHRLPQVDCSCTLLAHIEESQFMNRRQLRLRVVDVV